MEGDQPLVLFCCSFSFPYVTFLLSNSFHKSIRIILSEKFVLCKKLKIVNPGVAVTADLALSLDDSLRHVITSSLLHLISYRLCLSNKIEQHI